MEESKRTSTGTDGDTARTRDLPDHRARSESAGDAGMRGTEATSGGRIDDAEQDGTETSQGPRAITDGGYEEKTTEDDEGDEGVTQEGRASWAGNPGGQYRLWLTVGESVTFDRSDFFEDVGGATATWTVDGETAGEDEEFEFEAEDAGTHEILLEYDDRRIRRVVEVGVSGATLLDPDEDVLYLVVIKLRSKLYFLPVHAGSETTDLSDHRDRAIEQFENNEPASYEFARRQNDQWETGILERPMLDYSAIDEGVYALYDDDLYYLGRADDQQEELASLKQSLEHDATVEDVRNASPSDVFRDVMDVAEGFDTDQLDVGRGDFVIRPNWSDGGVFETWVGRNVDAMFANFGDHMRAFGVDPGRQRVGVMFGYNTQNFTFSTRFADGRLGISRQYTNMLGFGGGRRSGEGEGFGVGVGSGVREGRSDGRERGLVPRGEMFGDGEGFTLGFNKSSGQGTMMNDGEGGMARYEAFWESAQPGDRSPNGTVEKVNENPRGEHERVVHVDHEDENKDKIVFVQGSDSEDGGSEPSGEGSNGGSEPSGEGSNGGSEPSGEGSNGGSEPSGEGSNGGDGGDGDGDSEPGGAGEAGITPANGGTGGGMGPAGGGSPRGGNGGDGEGDGEGEPGRDGEGEGEREDGRLPFGTLGGMNGGCRGGGYTDPSPQQQGPVSGGGGGGTVGPFLGAVCPMGPEPLTSLTLAPGEGATGSMRVGNEQVIADMVDALTQPGPGYRGPLGPGGPRMSVDINGVSEAAAGMAFESDGGSVPPIGDGGSAPRTTRVFRISDSSVATAMGMDRTERLVGAVDGHSVKGLFGFADGFGIGSRSRPERSADLAEIRDEHRELLKRVNELLD